MLKKIVLLSIFLFMSIPYAADASNLTKSIKIGNSLFEIYANVKAYLSSLSSDDTVTFQGTEGVCSEWSYTWTTTKKSETFYSGTVDQIHIGGTCASPGGNSLKGEVEVHINKDQISAIVRHSDKNNCHYKGTIVGSKATGTQNCTSFAHDTTWVLYILK